MCVTVSVCVLLLVCVVFIRTAQDVRCEKKKNSAAPHVTVANRMQARGRAQSRSPDNSCNKTDDVR